MYYDVWSGPALNVFRVEETFLQIPREEFGDGCSAFNSKAKKLFPCVKIGAFCRK